MRCLIFALCLMASPALTLTIAQITVCFVPGPEDCAIGVHFEVLDIFHVGDTWSMV
jgi:hypothetical protein